MTLLKLSHLEHFVIGNISSKLGKEFVKENFCKESFGED